MEESAAEQAAQLRAVLDKYSVPDKSVVAKLPRYTGSKDTPRGQREKKRCNECGNYHEFPAVHLDYVGWADINRLLIEIDPLWDWEPIEWQDGAPKIVVSNGTATMWGRLKLHGVWRLGVGTCEASKAEMFKELYGDFLRNASAKFGIALKLWSKSQWETDDEPERPQPQRQAKQAQPVSSKLQPTIDAMMESIADLPDNERRRCKAEFVEKIGKPENVTEANLDMAFSIIQKYIDEANGAEAPF